MVITQRKTNFPSFINIVATLIVVLVIVTTLLISANYSHTGTSVDEITISWDESNDTLLAVNATIIEIVNSHAWENHGIEVNAAFKCLNNNGSTRSFQTFGFKDEKGNPIKTNLWLCLDADKTWYAIVTTTLEKIGGNRIGRLVTAYKIDTSLFPTIESFIIKIQQLWFAREITFQILKDTIHLSPK